ncbi:MAG TPA: aldehyde-activating protein [Erythrobacter sp.]|nr:aldehyde-activating protein [Erythrobacter sp.]
MGTTGGCLCGAVRYELGAEPGMPMICHCKNCQRQAGTAFSTIVGVPESAIKVTGTVKSYQDKGDLTGKSVRREFCGECGSPLFSHVKVAPGMVWIKAGTLDDTSDFVPAVQIWGKSKQCWLDLGDIPILDTAPDAG